MPRAAKKPKKKLDRAFAPEAWGRAVELARQYQLILRQEGGQWHGRGLELPRVFADGRTAAGCVSNLRDAMTAAVATMIEQGQAPPPPAHAGKRTEQVNVRLSAEEKIQIEAAAARRGFVGASDYFRAAAMGGV